MRSRGVLLVVAAALSTSCGDVTRTGPGPPTGSERTLQVDGAELVGEVDGIRRDYVMRCDTTPVTVSLTTADSHAVVGPVKLSGSEAVVITADRVDPITLRCLPDRFPALTRTGPPPGVWLATALVDLAATGDGWLVVTDPDGTPVWWKSTVGLGDFDAVDDELITFEVTHGAFPGFATQPDAHFAVTDLADGSERQVRIPGQVIDFHELLLEEDRIFAIAYEIIESSGDPLPDKVSVFPFPPFGAPACTSAAPTPAERQARGRIVELDDSGAVLRTWRAEDHLSVLDSPGVERANVLGTSDAPDCVIDVEHLNALAPGRDADELVVTSRHMDGVFALDWPSGDITWKVGGSPSEQSLRIVGDRAGGPHRPHDGQLLDGDRLLLWDNRSGLAGPARAVIYQLDRTARTATLVSEFAVPCSTPPFCSSEATGSVRMVGDSTLVVAPGVWDGATVLIYDAQDAELQSTLTFEMARAYRSLPVTVDADALRADMAARQGETPQPGSLPPAAPPK